MECQQAFCAFLIYVLNIAEEQCLSVEDQGDVLVVVDVDRTVICHVQDSKEYQHSIQKPDSTRSKARKKAQGKVKAANPSDSDSKGDSAPTTFLASTSTL